MNLYGHHPKLLCLFSDIVLWLQNFGVLWAHGVYVEWKYWNVCYVSPRLVQALIHCQIWIAFSVPWDNLRREAHFDYGRPFQTILQHSYLLIISCWGAGFVICCLVSQVFYHWSPYHLHGLVMWNVFHSLGLISTGSRNFI